MEIVGTSSLWVEKFRPRTVADLILPNEVSDFFKQQIKDGELTNCIFTGSAGRGKTSAAISLCNDLDADVLQLNGSIDNGIDTLRYKVQSFAMTSSFKEGKKVVFIDEFERLTAAAQDGLKALIEQVESNCRFILTTNNISKVIDPVKSRCQIVDFNFSQKDTKNLIVKYFKRICWILEQEKVKYENEVIVEFCKKMFPDFRKTINELQRMSKTYGEIDNRIFKNLEGSISDNLIEEIKAKKFNSVRKLCTEVDTDQFYTDFYSKIDEHLQDSSKPDIILLLGKYVFESSLSVNREITLVSFCTEVMLQAKWK